MAYERISGLIRASSVLLFAAGLIAGAWWSPFAAPREPAAPAGTAARDAAPAGAPVALSVDDPAAGRTGAGAGAIAGESAPGGGLTAEERATIDLFREASPAAVYITAIAVRRDMFSMNVMEIPQGTGSGFVWDENGHIVTNFHVIRGADRAQVTLADNSAWEARLVGTAPDKDLAVLRIEAPREELHVLRVGSSHDLLVGQKVLAIGNPFGLDQTLTTGIISALGREIESVTRIPIRDVIQTDAAINPGNSGGPLLDSSGRLIGVNTAIYSPSGASAGIGFAIPVDVVKWVVPELIAHGKVTRAALGVHLATQQVAERLGIAGALVIEVVQGTGADQAGVRPTRRDETGKLVLGDIIVAIDGEPVKDSNDLILLLEKKKPGDRVRVEVMRDEKRHELTVTLSPSG
jgi:S1-C subfamily serine protease